MAVGLVFLEIAIDETLEINSNLPPEYLLTKEFKYPLQSVRVVLSQGVLSEVESIDTLSVRGAEISLTVIALDDENSSESIDQYRCEQRDRGDVLASNSTYNSIKTLAIVSSDNEKGLARSATLTQNPISLNRWVPKV